MKLTSLPIYVFLLFLAGCDKPPPSHVEAAKDLVRSKLRDPASARFRNVQWGYSHVCGEVNSRNGFGGYGGFQRFTACADCDPPFVDFGGRKYTDDIMCDGNPVSAL